MGIFFHCPKALVQVQFDPDAGWVGGMVQLAKPKIRR